MLWPTYGEVCIGRELKSLTKIQQRHKTYQQLHEFETAFPQLSPETTVTPENTLIADF